MSRILKDFFHEGIYPTEAIVPKDPEYREVNHEITQAQEYLKGKVSGEDAPQLERLDFLYCEMASIYAGASFAYGFKLAVALMVEALAELDGA